MRYYAFLLFSSVVIITGLAGFGAVVFAATGITKWLVYAFVIAVLVSLITHLGRGQRIHR